MKYTKLTPNLVVRDVQAAVNFYESVLGFERGMSAPDNPPLVFASVTNGAGVEIFFNDQKVVGEDYPPLAKDPLGGTLTLFLECEGIEQVLSAVESRGENHHASEDTILRNAGIRFPGPSGVDCDHGRTDKVGVQVIL
jgi:catechol 2,3-dioxygenase-like lactoylglutathione lyase family enzyme